MVEDLTWSSPNMNVSIDTATYITATNFTTVAVSQPEYLSVCIYRRTPQFELLLVHIFKLYLGPVISTIGFSANMLSIAILRKSGLSKPSNILLLGMVLADSMTQMHSMNFAEILMLLGPDYKYPKVCGWQYGDGLNYFLMVFDIMFMFFSSLGQCVNTTIPIIITLERFLAVFMPMTFKKIVTVKTAWISVVTAYVFWLPWILYNMSLNGIVSQFPGVMFFVLMFTRYTQPEAFILLNDYVFPTITTWVPMIIIGIGSVLIGIKVKMTLVKRKRLTSNKEKVPWSARTTRTLLITCAFFFVSVTFDAMVGIFEASIPNAYYVFVFEVVRLNDLLNASSNFFIYITSNRKFFTIFKDIVSRKNYRSC